VEKIGSTDKEKTDLKKRSYSQKNGIVKSTVNPWEIKGRGKVRREGKSVSGKRKRRGGKRNIDFT